jgi:hypothetical protein
MRNTRFFVLYQNKFSTLTPDNTCPTNANPCHLPPATCLDLFSIRNFRISFVFELNNDVQLKSKKYGHQWRVF